MIHPYIGPCGVFPLRRENGTLASKCHSPDAWHFGFKVPFSRRSPASIFVDIVQILENTFGSDVVQYATIIGQYETIPNDTIHILTLPIVSVMNGCREEVLLIV